MKERTTATGLYIFGHNLRGYMGTASHTAWYGECFFPLFGEGIYVFVWSCTWYCSCESCWAINWDQIWLCLIQMSALYSVEEVQKLLQGILKSLPLEHSSNQCSNSTTPGWCCELCMQLDTVDLKLCAHFEEINKLLKIKAEVKGFFNQCHDPLTCLPVEIALHIFSIYTEAVRATEVGQPV